MKKIPALLIVFLLNMAAYAQGGTWTWMKGSNIPNAAGSYGTKGVANASNVPPNRYQAAYWRDFNGDFWLFGGSMKQGLNIVLLNDLWKYSIATNTWTWMSGPQLTSDQNGEYGTQGIGSINNYPSARGNGSICWVDNTGTFWLYAGEGIDVSNNNGVLSDLWKYDITTNEWTWVKGSNLINQNAVYGSLGVPNITNTPGPRNETQSGWVDNVNDLWLCGGNKSSSVSNFLDDMWRYNIATNTWTWMKGSSTPNGGGNYGVKNVEAATNLPPARWSYTKWKSKSGKFYSFAGQTQLGTLNDVWQYNTATNNWTWISGSNALNHPGTYNVQCAPDSFNYPPSRYENQTAQTIGCADVFWTFGGRSQSLANFNDLWIYNTLTNKWAWVSGSSALNSTGSYGTLGVANASNMISARFGVCMWTDNANNVWVYGGQNSVDYYNDMWRFQPDTSCFSAPLTATFELQPPIDSVICLGDTTSIGVPITATASWAPNAGVFPNADTSILYFSPLVNTTYTITGVDTGLCPGVDTLIFSLAINSSQTPNLIAPSDTSICPGESTSMTLDPNLSVNYFPTTGATPNADTSLITFNPSVTTTYTVIGKFGTCSLPDTVKFTILVTNGGNVNIAAPNPSIICEGEQTIMNIDPSYTVNFSPNIGVIPNADTSQLTFSPTTTTTYTVTANTFGNCASGDTVVFTINVVKPTKVVAPSIPNTSICAGQGFNVVLDATQLIFTSISPMAGVTLSAGNSVANFTPSVNTFYTVIVDGLSCSIPDTVQFSVSIKPSPTANFSMTPTSASLSNANFVMNNLSINATGYQWYFNNTIFSDKVNATKTITDTGKFCITLVAIGTGTCNDTTEVCGYVNEDSSYLFMPNAFSPNGDRLNDEFKPFATLNVELLQFIIYNRWGEEVFNNKSGYWGWDGKHKTQEMPVGVYNYYLKYKIKGQEKILKGDVTLVR